MLRFRMTREIEEGQQNEKEARKERKAKRSRGRKVRAGFF